MSDIRLQATPGPWVTMPSEPWIADHEHAHSCANIGIGSEGGVIVALAVTVAHHDDPQFEANARLIAASPTMADYIQRRADEGDAEAASIMETVHACG